MRELAIFIVWLLVTVSGGSVDAQVGIRGPDAIPMSLPGPWKVSLCMNHGHAWIRFQHAETGEVHTIGRYPKGEGGLEDPETGRKTWPDARQSGLQWDMDLKYEDQVCAGRYLLLSGYVENPRIVRGENNGYGHGLWRVNCATYARDAWAYYTGEYYHLPVIAAPDDFRAEVVRCHPEVLRTKTTVPAAHDALLQPAQSPPPESQSQQDSAAYSPADTWDDPSVSADIPGGSPHAAPTQIPPVHSPAVVRDSFASPTPDRDAAGRFPDGRHLPAPGVRTGPR